jgi:hypothetical protein
MAARRTADDSDLGDTTSDEAEVDDPTDDDESFDDPALEAAMSLQQAFEEQAAYAQSQWGQGRGIVGPRGSEENTAFAPFNDPTVPGYSLAQSFAFQHDMQTIDADAQGGISHGVATAVSAAIGMAVTAFTGDPDLGAAASQSVFGAFGFSVQASYGAANAPAGTPAPAPAPATAPGGGSATATSSCGWVEFQPDGSVVEVHLPDGLQTCPTQPRGWAVAVPAGTPAAASPPPPAPVVAPLSPPRPPLSDDVEPPCRNFKYCMLR